MPTLAERLGYGPDDRLLIMNCDDLGACHAANVGVYEAMRNGVATSASLMVPAPWARAAAAQYLGEDVGVHLTLNAEYDLYRWGPITQAPSLLDGDGGFPRTVEDVWDHADLDEVRKECRAQIERAILWGFDVSHLDSHMGTLQLRPEFFDIYLELAAEFRLPIRLSGASTERIVGFPFRRLAAEEGVLFPDHFVLVPNGVGSRRVRNSDASSGTNSHLCGLTKTESARSQPLNGSRHSGSRAAAPAYAASTWSQSPSCCAMSAIAATGSTDVDDVVPILATIAVGRCPARRSRAIAASSSAATRR